MKRTEEICPTCDKGRLKKGTVKETMFGVYLGDFPAEICDVCGESFTDEITTRAIEQAAKAKGIWGLGERTKIARTGNSIAVRIPVKIARSLNIKEGDEVFIHPEGKNILIETE